MLTQEIPYAVNTEAWHTGLAFYNHNPQKISFAMTIRNKSGKQVFKNLYDLGPYSQLAFVPKAEGSFSCIIEGPVGLSVVAILDKGKGGCLVLPVKEIPSSVGN